MQCARQCASRQPKQNKKKLNSKLPKCVLMSIVVDLICNWGKSVISSIGNRQNDQFFPTFGTHLYGHNSFVMPHAIVPSDPMHAIQMHRHRNACSTHSILFHFVKMHFKSCSGFFGLRAASLPMGNCFLLVSTSKQRCVQCVRVRDATTLSHRSLINFVDENPLWHLLKFHFTRRRRKETKILLLCILCLDSRPNASRI